MATTARAVREVREHTVRWDQGLGDAGGFRWADGRRILDYGLLVELWQAKHRGLIAVDGGVVLLSKQRSQS